MNKNGFVSGFELGFLATTVVLCATTLGIPSIREGHQKKKALAQCEKTRNVNECRTLIDNSSKAQILDYIRDDELWGNQGYVN